MWGIDFLKAIIVQSDIDGERQAIINGVLLYVLRWEISVLPRIISTQDIFTILVNSWVIDVVVNQNNFRFIFKFMPLYYHYLSFISKSTHPP